MDSLNLMPDNFSKFIKKLNNISKKPLRIQ
jgi:hypothetical protein